MTDEVFHRAQMQHQPIGTGVVLDAVRLPAGEVQAYFKTGTAGDEIKPGEGTEITMIRSVGDGMIVSLPPVERPTLVVSGEEVGLTVRDHEQSLFKGFNTAFAIRNGESAEVTLRWLSFHQRHQGLQAALILDRARPGEAEGFAAELEAGVKSIKGLKRVVWVQADIPLGASDLPPEAHPMNAPDAPGKDRMEVPAPSPWDSPLGELQLFEWARHRFLYRGR